MVTGNWGAQHGMLPATRAAVEVFWSYTAFLLNSFVFLLMGLEINLAKLAHYLPEILIGLGGHQSGAWRAGVCQLLRS